MISEIYKNNPKLNIVTSVKNFMDNSNNKTAKYLLSKDIFASDVYTLGYDKNSYAKLDYTKRIITKD